MSILAYPPPAVYDEWLEAFISEQADSTNLIGQFQPNQLRRRWQLMVAGYLHIQAAKWAPQERKWTSHLLVSPDIVIGLKTSPANYSGEHFGILSIISSSGFLDGDGIIEACTALRDIQTEHRQVWENQQILGLQIDCSGCSSFFTHNPHTPASHPRSFSMLTREEFFAYYRQVLLHLHNGHGFSNEWQEVDPAGYEICNPLRKEKQVVPTIAHGIHIIRELLQACSEQVLEVLRNKPMLLKSKSSKQTVWTSKSLLD